MLERVMNSIRIDTYIRTRLSISRCSIYACKISISVCACDFFTWLWYISRVFFGGWTDFRLVGETNGKLYKSAFHCILHAHGSVRTALYSDSRARNSKMQLQSGRGWAHMHLPMNKNKALVDESKKTLLKVKNTNKILIAVVCVCF